jgi:hypothetical protein
MIHPGPAHESAPAAAKPVIPVADDGAAVWRTVTRLLAWVGLAYGSCSVGEFLGDMVRRGPLYGPYTAIRSIPMAKDIVELHDGIHAIAALALAVVLVVGSVGVLAGRRWGSALIMAYALGMVPTAVIHVAWITLSLRDYRMSAWSFWVSVGTFVLDALRSWSFPAVVFFTLRAYRKHRAGAAPAAAFEPLPAAVPVQP